MKKRREFKISLADSNKDWLESSINSRTMCRAFMMSGTLEVENDERDEQMVRQYFS